MIHTSVNLFKFSDPKDTAELSLNFIRSEIKIFLGASMFLTSLCMTLKDLKIIFINITLVNFFKISNSKSSELP
jgi:hypothetical protein